MTIDPEIIRRQVREELTAERDRESERKEREELRARVEKLENRRSPKEEKEDDHAFVE